MPKPRANLFRRPDAPDEPPERSPEQLLADYQAHLAEAVSGHPESAEAPFTLDPFIYTPADMWREPRPHDIIPGLVFERSMGMIVSEPHVGKTLMLLDLAIAVSSAQRWIAWQAAKPLPALVFALDSPGWESSEQARNLMAGRGIDPRQAYPLFAVATRERTKAELGRFDILNPRHFARVSKLARDMGAKLVGFDSFSKIHRCEENERGAMEEVMDAIESLAHQTGAHVMVMHHSPVVARSSRTTNAGRGSSVIGASIDLEFHLSKRKDGSRLLDVLKGRGSDIADQRFKLTLERVHHPEVPRAVRWAVETDSEGDPAAVATKAAGRPQHPNRAKLREVILAALVAGPRSRADLATMAHELGLYSEDRAYSTVGNILSDLAESGEVAQVARGMWGKV